MSWRGQTFSASSVQNCSAASLTAWCKSLLRLLGLNGACVATGQQPIRGDQRDSQLRWGSFASSFRKTWPASIHVLKLSRVNRRCVRIILKIGVMLFIVLHHRSRHKHKEQPPSCNNSNLKRFWLILPSLKAEAKKSLGFQSELSDD